MNLGLIGRYVLIVVYVVPTCLFLYFFFNVLLNFWLSGVVALIMAVATTYLITKALLRSRAPAVQKLLTSTVIAVTIIAFTCKLLLLQVEVNNMVLIVNELQSR